MLITTHTSYFTLNRLNSLLDSYLSKVKKASDSDEKENHPVVASKSGQPGEDDDEVEDQSLGIKSKDKTAKKHKKEPLTTPVQEAQVHAMKQSSSFSNGFASIAESFKPDTPEQFEAKALAASKLIG